MQDCSGFFFAYTTVMRIQLLFYSRFFAHFFQMLSNTILVIMLDFLPNAESFKQICSLFIIQSRNRIDCFHLLLLHPIRFIAFPRIVFVAFIF